ncbi:MAG: RT0821/Lpp0805 family surface protein [Gammaproteobacteria bacterium]|nr:RT0821/Lpp0805 family surface protein [Gammaproteobacteria bacterium]
MQLVAKIILLLSVVAVFGCATVNQVQDPEPLYTRMTPDDVLAANETVRNALENALSGMRLSWKSTTSGHSGSVTPVNTFKTKSGLYCRVYEEMLTIGKQTERYTDTACRDSKGRWRPVVVN